MNTVTLRDEEPISPAEPLRPAVRWLAWVGYLLAWSLALLTPYPVYLSAWLLPEGLPQFLAAKGLHVTAYAVLAVLTGWLRAPTWLRPLLLLALSAHALGTEGLQYFVYLRHPSWRDVALNHIGLMLGLALSWGWWHARQAVRSTDVSAS
jgi:hypothetical protein